MLTPILLLLFGHSSLNACLPALELANSPLLSLEFAASTPLSPQGAGKSKKSGQDTGDASAVESMAGLVEIPKGKVHLGVSENDAKKEIAANPGAAQGLGATVGQMTADLPRFFIGPTEVTNEMYLRFVQDTGAMPPPSWAKFSREKRLEIITALQKANPAASFDATAQATWWQEHWQDGEVKWEVSKEEALMPVSFISHRDAIAYCKWAGLRMPTEKEWIRAARGDDKKLLFPFGKTYKAEAFAHLEATPRNLARKLVPAASLPGESSFGIADLSGNLWEWTDTPFTSISGFRPFTVKTEAGDVAVAPSFDAASRIIKGGSYVNKGEVCNVNIRPGLTTHFRAPIIGFRVASSERPCYNAALYAARGVSSAILGGDPNQLLASEEVVGLEIRKLVDDAELEAARADPKKPLPKSNLPEGYKVFDRYNALAAIPLRDLNIKKGKLDRTVEESGPFPIGVLHSTVALEKANTLSGTYIMMYVGPLEAETILDLKATLPPRHMIDDYEPKELAEGVIPITDLWPKMEGLSLAPNSEYVLLVDKDNNGVGVLPLIKPPKYGKIRTAEPGVIVNLDKGYIEYRMVIPTGRNDSWTFRFSMVPRGKDGALTRRNSWDGDYFKVIEPVEED